MKNQHDKHRVKENLPMDETNTILCEVQKNLQLLVKKEKNYMEQFKTHHKIIFAFLIFFAINLLWYGMWGIVSMLPILKNPIVALIVGALMLTATGYFYENLISAEFNKKSRREAWFKVKTHPNPPPHLSSPSAKAEGPFLTSDT